MRTYESHAPPLRASLPAPLRWPPRLTLEPRNGHRNLRQYGPRFLFPSPWNGNPVSLVSVCISLAGSCLAVAKVTLWRPLGRPQTLRCLE